MTTIVTRPEFDPTLPLERAWTIPSRWYLDPSMLAAEQEAIFARTWQWVGRSDQVAEPGQFFTVDVAGEPLVVLRDESGTLRAFSNVCRHRAGPVARGEGRCEKLRCGYHGWTYSLGGRLIGTPDWEGVCDFDKSAVHLPAVSVAEWGAYIWVRLEGDAALALDDLAAHLAPLQLDRFRFGVRKTHRVACNWKAYIDNFIDGGYHLPMVHPALSAVTDYSRYVLEERGNYNVQTTPGRPPRQGDVEYRKGDQAFYYWIFPNFMINFYAEVVELNRVVPRGPSDTEIVFDFYFTTDDAEVIERCIRCSDQVQEEDRRICEDVQRGLASRSYDRGRLSVRRENGVLQFHKLLAEALA